MYEEMLAFVKTYLQENNGEISQNGAFPFRVRSDHIKRVYMWTRRLSDGVSCIDTGSLFIAAIFHDIGYANAKNNVAHAENSAIIFNDYARAKGYDDEKRQFISYLIANHSNKQLLKNADTPLELIILMEADLLDETGALSVIWDCMMEGSKENQSFTNTYEHIKRYSGAILNENRMVTEKAKLYWSEKQQLVRMFIEQLAFDMGVEGYHKPIKEGDYALTLEQQEDLCQ